MKKILSLMLAGLLVLGLFCACGSSLPLVCISQYGEHASLDNCRTGFLEGLKDAGLTAGVDFEVNYQNAGFNDAMATQIAQSFTARSAALMCAIATPSAQACFNEGRQSGIPTVFVAVTDPEEAKLTTGNVTGTSDRLPVEGQLKLIRALQPEAKTIGILYSSGEANSVSSIREYEALVGKYGFTLNAVAVTAQSEVPLAAEKLIADKVDCFSNLTDNTVVGVLDAILEKTNDAGIPVYGSEIEQVKRGCVAGAGIDYFELGRQTGALAAKILKGEAKAEDLPYETISEYGLYLNADAAEKLGLTVPAVIAQQAQSVTK